MREIDERHGRNGAMDGVHGSPLPYCWRQLPVVRSIASTTVRASPTALPATARYAARWRRAGRLTAAHIPAARIDVVVVLGRLAQISAVLALPEALPQAISARRFAGGQI